MYHNKNYNISVVIPTYNSDGILGISIRSALEQEFKDMEIIIVDDCSTDLTFEIMGWAVEQHKNVSGYRNNTRKGAAFCRNFGNRKAKGKYVMVLDAGDIMHPKRAKIQYSFLEKNKDIDCCYSSVAIVDSLGKIQDYQAAKFYKGCKGERPVICHPTMMYKKSSILEIPYNEESIDTDQYERMILEWNKAGKKFGSIDSVLVHKLKDKHSGYRDLRKAYLKRYEIYKEYGLDIPIHIKKSIGK